MLNAIRNRQHGPVALYGISIYLSALSPEIWEHGKTIIHDDLASSATGDKWRCMTVMVMPVMNGDLKPDTDEWCISLSNSINSDISRPFRKWQHSGSVCQNT